MVETVTDLELAKKQLYDGTISVYEFDQKYGQGAADSVISNTYRTPEQIAADNAAQEDNRSFIEKAGEVIADVFQGVARGPFGAAAETYETQVNATQMGTDEAQSLYDKTINYRNEVLQKAGLPAMSAEEEQAFAQRMGVALASGGIAVRDERINVDGQDLIDQVGLTDALQIDTVAGSLSEGISQFTTGFLLLGGGKTFIGSMIKGGVVDAVAFDPYEANLSSFLQENGWAQNAVTEALKTDPNAPEWENRLRNTIEGGVTGIALEGIIKGIKFVALGRKANTEIKELGKISDDTAEQLDEVHEQAADIEEQIATDKSDALVAKPDGTFEAPDGTSYKPDGEVLTLKSEQRVDAPVETRAADEIQQPKAQEDAPQALPEAAARPDVASDAPAQPTITERTPDEILRDNVTMEAAPEVTRVAPKIEVIDKQVFDDALTRAREMGDFELRSMEEGAFVNFERMKGPVEAAKIIDALQDVISNSAGFKKMGAGGVETHGEVVKKALQYTASNTGTDVNKLIRDLNVRETISQDMAARIVAGKMALQSTGKRISDLADKIEALAKTGKSTEEVDRELVDLMQMHVELQANVKGLQTSAARATAAGRITTADALKVDSLDTLSLFGGSERVRQLAKQIRGATDDAARSKLIKKAVERKWLRVLNEYWINSILSGYTTHALNLTSNTINLLARPLERGVGAALSGNGKETLKALKTYVYLGAYLKDSVVMAAKSGWNHRAILDNSAKIDAMQGIQTPRAMSSEFLGIQNKVGSTVVDVLGKGLTMPSRILGTEDEFFKQLAFRSNLRANITVDAGRLSIQDLNKMGYNSRKEFIDAEFEKAFETKISAEERWQEMVLTGKVADDAKVKEQFIAQTIGQANQRSSYALKALNEARETTFTNPLKKGTMSHSFQELANKHPLLRQIIPFIQTPMNIMNNAWDRTPVLNLMRQEYREALSSTDPEIRAQAVGKMALGTAIYSSLTYLAMEGRITGGGPTDPKLAALYRNSKDWQPYSINVGSQDNPVWVSYQRMDPWTTAFGVVGDISEMVEMGQMAESDATDFISMSIAAIGNNIVSKTYLQGISDVVDIMNSKDSPWEVQGFLKQRAASLLPYSSMTGQLNNAFDDNLREVRTVLDQFRRQTGIQRSTLPLKYDWLTGEPLETPEKVLGYIQVKKQKAEDKDIATINKEMRKLNYKFAGADRKIGGITLTPEQYQRWNQLMGTTKIGGKTLSDAMLKEIDKPRYRKDDDDYNLVLTRDSHRVQMLNRQVSRYRDRAKRLLYKEFPNLQQQVREYDRYSDKAKRGNIGVQPELDMNNLE